MDRNTELELLDRCLSLYNERKTELMEEEVTSSVDRYTSSDRFALEMDQIFKTSPLIVAHSSELSENNSYIAREWLEGFPLLVTRDADGSVHAFANVCKHRGGKLAEEGKGCSRRLICPYHAWSYDLDGTLKTIPHEKTGFPSFDKENSRLKELPCVEAYGFIWVQRDEDCIPNIDAYLEGMGTDLVRFTKPDHVLFDEAIQDWNLNWKILVEGGIESYHFKIAHRDTIAPLFNDNLSVFDEFGPHFRSVLTKSSIKKLRETNREKWDIREHANVLYSLYPLTSVLVQPDHFAVVNAIPLAAEKTRIAIQTFVPKGSDLTEKAKAHWQANFDFTRDTLIEDFVIGEHIQQGISTGANESFTFGRFEAALARFHEITEAKLGNV